MQALNKSSQDARLETRLLESVTQRDDGAFEQLYEIYYKRLHRFLFRMVGNDAGIQEIINDVMFVVWEKAGTFDHTSKVSTWIFGIAVRTAKKYLSQKYKNADTHESLLDDEPDREDWEKGVERRDWLEKAMAKLSPEQRAVVELTYFHGLHYREAAEIMGCPENTIKTRMFHSRAKLRDELRDSAGSAKPKSADSKDELC